MRWLIALLLASSLPTSPSWASTEDYIPSEAERIEVQRLTDTYLELLDDRNYAAAYAMQGDSLQAITPFHEWFAVSEQSRQHLGDNKERKQTGTTWYLDPPDSPGPGLYAAVDFQSRYENSKQHSEYLVWVRKKGTDRFELMRHETTFLANDPQSTDAPLSGYMDSQEPQPPLPEAASGAIGFPNVEAARTALSTRDNAVVRTMQDGWMVIEDPADNSVWSFTPLGHPAHPAVVKRYVFSRDGSVMLGMDALCQAGKQECDQLIRQFQKMNKEAGRKTR